MSDSSKDKKIESSIPNWVVYALLGAVTFLIVKSIHTALLTLLVSGGVMLFIWSYLSKPVAEIQPSRDVDDSNQMNIFHKNKINRNTFNKVTETNPQRKRYLRSIDDVDNAA
tara:strand:+ start:160 stop:495 length:336 start_codon:yes stop_codon:yes gene_type:complete